MAREWVVVGAFADAALEADLAAGAPVGLTDGAGFDAAACAAGLVVACAADLAGVVIVAAPAVGETCLEPAVR